MKSNQRGGGQKLSNANELLRRLRKYNELTYKDMADLINVSPRTYSDKEKGISQFKQYEMFIISRRFQKSIDEIFLPENFMIHEVDEMKEGVEHGITN